MAGRRLVQINISVRHGQLSDAARDKIRAKLERLGRFFERLTSIQCTVDLEHEEKPKVEVHVDAEHKHDFVAAESGESSVFAALDKVVDKIEEQLRRYKEKIQEHHRSRPKPLDESGSR